MKVTVAYQYYQGYLKPGHSLMYEMTQALAAHGHEVTVISGESGYMHPDQPRLPWYRRLLRRERDGLVQVIRLYTSSNPNRSYWRRALGFVTFLTLVPLGFFVGPKPDVVLASSPPLFSMLPVVWICRLRRIPLVFEVRDLWPESIVQLGLVKNRWLIALMTWMETISYNAAVRIVALTHGIADDIQCRGWPVQKLHVITCGIDTRMLFPDPQVGIAIRTKHNWQGREIVLYLGAMGEAHHLDVIVGAARLCTRSRVLFVLVGDGMERVRLQTRISDLGLDNICILPPVPKTAVRGYLCAADICLATLKDIALFKGAIPTKLLDYMACGRPVLCGIAGEAAAIVETAGAGRVFPPDDAQALVQAVDELLDDAPARARMGEAGVAYILEHFNIITSCTAMRELLETVAANKTSIPSENMQQHEQSH